MRAGSNARSLRGRRRLSEASVNSSPIFRLVEARSGRYATKPNGKSGRSGAAAASRASAAQTPSHHVTFRGAFWFSPVRSRARGRGFAEFR